VRSETTSTPASERLAKHPLPQSTLHAPLFAGVEAPVLAFEVMALLVVVHATGQRWLVVGMVGAVLLAVHWTLAAATKKDRRLSLVFSRSLRVPRFAGPWATPASSPRPAEPSFPRRLLT
jgi:type IV secretory pathway TrbD component